MPDPDVDDDDAKVSLYDLALDFIIKLIWIICLVILSYALTRNNNHENTEINNRAIRTPRHNCRSAEH
jgi:hypothetical protein